MNYRAFCGICFKVCQDFGQTLAHDSTMIAILQHSNFASPRLLFKFLPKLIRSLNLSLKQLGTTAIKKHKTMGG